MGGGGGLKSKEKVSRIIWMAPKENFIILYERYCPLPIVTNDNNKWMK